MLNWLFKLFHKQAMLYTMNELQKKGFSVVQIQNGYLVDVNGTYHKIGRK